MYNAFSFPILKTLDQFQRNTMQFAIKTYLVYSTCIYSQMLFNVVLKLFFIISGFGDVLLSGVLALSEQRSIVADYSSFK